MNRRLRKGFTLVELMVVIVIIGILGTIVVLNFGDTDDQAKVGAAKASLRSLHKAVQLYQMRVEADPETLEELVTGPSDWEDSWSSLVEGGVSALKDPWDNPYVLEYDDNGDPIILSYGADGEEGPGTRKIDKDLTYPEEEEE